MTPIPAVSIGDSLQTGFDKFFGFLPNIIAFLLILVIGYIIAKAVRTVVNKLLEKVGVDKKLHETPAGQYVEKVSPDSRPSHLIGATAFWIIFLIAIINALQALKLPVLNGFLDEVLLFLPSIVEAVLIFVVAAVLAGGVAAAVTKLMGDTPTGKLVATIAPTLIMTIAVFMILTTLTIAPEIVIITYIALLGTLALAGGLAFGLGGREVAADLLRSAQDNAGQVKDQAKQDAQLAKERGQEQKDRAQTQVQGGPSSGGTGSSSSGGGTQPLR